MKRKPIQCPHCASQLDPQWLRSSWGKPNEVVCPICCLRLRYSPPYRLIMLGASLPLLAFFIATTGFRDGAIVAVASVAAWIGVSMAASAVLSYVKPPKLKLAPRRPPAAPELLRKRDYN
jgi:hypothetical protein